MTLASSLWGSKPRFASAWMAIFHTATAIWPEHNPIVDDHVIGAAVLAGLFLANAGRYYGLGKVWQRVDFVKGRRYLH